MAVSNGRRVVAGIALAGAVGVGALGVATISPLGAAGAQEDPSTTEQPAASATSNPRPGRGEVLDEVLAGLVADGTLDQTQADAVAEAFAAKGEELREQFGPGGGGFDGHRGEGLDAAAEALGLEVDALKEQLRGGTTLAQVAEAQGVDVQVVIDALVASATERIDAALAEGRIDEAKATELKEDLVERVTERVTTPREERHGPGRPGRGGEAPEDAPSTDDTQPEAESGD